MTTLRSAAATEPVPLEDLVARWVADGLISGEQGVLLAESWSGPVRAAPPHRHGRSIVIETVAYLGGAIVVTASVLLGSLWWSDLGPAARTTLLTVAAVALVLGGAAVDASPGTASGRLRSALWMAAVVAGAFAMGVGADAAGLDETETAITATTGAAAVAGVLWFRWRNPVQQGTAMVAAAAAGAALVADRPVPDATIGLGPWAVGVVWALLAWSGLMVPRRFGLTGGAVIAVVGAMMTGSTDAGTLLTLVTLALLTAAAVRLQEPLMLVVATVGVVANVPAAVARWFPGSVGVPVALLAVGLLVVLVAVLMARNTRTRAERPEPLPGSPTTALAAASVVVAGVAAAVATIARG